MHYNVGEMTFNVVEIYLSHDKIFTAMCLLIKIRNGIRKPGLEMNQAGSHFTN